MSDAFIALPSSGLAAIYDDEVKRLYLWAQGLWDTTIQGSFQRNDQDNHGFGPLKFKLVGVRAGEMGYEKESHATTMFEEKFINPERNYKKIIVETTLGPQEVEVIHADTVRIN